jgi:hypothetical protein
MAQSSAVREGTVAFARTLCWERKRELIARSRPGRALESVPKLASRRTSKYFWKVQRDIGGPAMTSSATNYLELSKGHRGVLAIVLLAFLMAGCGNDNRPAPKPTINPDAHVFTTIRIFVSDPRIDDVQVESNWVVGDLSCAPIVYPEGYAKVQQATVTEKVIKIEAGYRAQLLDDRFLRDKCNWNRGGGDIEFMRGGTVFSLLTMNHTMVIAGSRYELTCTPPFDLDKNRYSGDCYQEGHLPSKLKSNPGNYIVTLEFLP